MQLTLRQKITLLALFAALLPVLTLAALLSVEKGRVSDEVAREIDEVSRQHTAQIALDVTATCQAIHQLTQRQLDTSLASAHRLLAQDGDASLGTKPVKWPTLDAEGKPGAVLELPELLIGNKPLEPGAPLPLVAEISRTTGVTISIFQLVNAEGDMLRVATTVKTAKGESAVGSLLMHRDASGAPEPSVAHVLKGESCRGCYRVIGTLYVASYEPLRDAKTGRVIGMLGVGANPEALKELRKTILDTKVGKTGYVFVLQGTGPQRGTYIISKEGKQDGVNYYDMTDAGGRHFVHSIVAKATALSAGQVAYEQYPWRNPDEAVARPKIAALCYFEPWDWIIGAGMYEEDYYAAASRAKEALSGLLWNSLESGALVLVLAGLVSFWLGRRIAAPISRLTVVAQKVAEGDLQAAEALAGTDAHAAGPEASQAAPPAPEEIPRDETRQLVRAIQRMTRSLHAPIGQAKHSSVQLLSSATEISATAKQQENTLNDLGTSTNEIAAAVKEISATSQELVKTMGQVTTVSGQAAGLADAGCASLGELEARMKGLAGATQSISSKLAAISDKTTNITTIVATINKVADQTNLLSLNAAIEAEKAGEHGLGFSVVAREIRRLADQTAVATLDIEQMVKEMRSAVSSGVMEMDKFAEAMRRGVEETAHVSAQLHQIMTQVQELMPRFQAVQEGMQSQAQGAQQINEAMVQLTEGTRTTLASLREFNRATDYMHQAVRSLKDEISRFKVSE